MEILSVGDHQQLPKEMFCEEHKKMLSMKKRSSLLTSLLNSKE